MKELAQMQMQVGELEMRLKSVTATLGRHIETLESTILNLTARIGELEGKVFPRCPRCQQLLPEGKVAVDTGACAKA
jgi:hypothetical protein